jgi:psp operon transcriptional activator
VDVRIIGATNADLEQMAEDGRFKSDLLDRLSFEVLFLPPLRERKGDILLLANHFALRMAYELGWEETPIFSPEAAETLENYTWRGNVRELKNVVERAVYRAEAPVITDIVLDPFRSPYAPERTPKARAALDIASPPGPDIPDFTAMPLKSAVRSLEIHLLKDALTRANYNQKKAAATLGLTYDQFRGLRRKHANEIK